MRALWSLKQIINAHLKVDYFLKSQNLHSPFLTKNLYSLFAAVVVGNSLTGLWPIKVYLHPHTFDLALRIGNHINYVKVLLIIDEKNFKSNMKHADKSTRRQVSGRFFRFLILTCTEVLF